MLHKSLSTDNILFIGSQNVATILLRLCNPSAQKNTGHTAQQMHSWLKDWMQKSVSLCNLISFLPTKERQVCSMKREMMATDCPVLATPVEREFLSPIVTCQPYRKTDPLGPCTCSLDQLLLPKNELLCLARSRSSLPFNGMALEPIIERKSMGSWANHNGSCNCPPLQIN